MFAAFEDAVVAVPSRRSSVLDVGVRCGHESQYRREFAADESVHTAFVDNLSESRDQSGKSISISKENHGYVNALDRDVGKEVDKETGSSRGCHKEGGVRFEIF
ncbi:hypothetical protein V6N13_074385 [Hibiscus sabdariffa]